MRLTNNLIHKRHVGKVINKTNLQTNYKIMGKILVQGQSVDKRIPVVLVDSLNMQVIQKTISKSDGSYIFDWLMPHPHIVFATMPNKQFNAVIQDNMVPK